MLAGGVSLTSTRTIHGQGFTEVVFKRRGVFFRFVRLVLFTGAWLFGLMFGVVLMGVGDGSNPWFLPVWITGWGIGGLALLFGLVWSAFVIESLVARSDSLTLMRRLLLLPLPVVVPARSINDIRWVEDDPSRIVRVNGRRTPQTGIEIVADGRSIRCASGIGASEATAVIAELRQRLVIPKGRSQ